MNATEFLALVEKYPLPWEWDCTDGCWERQPRGRFSWCAVPVGDRAESLRDAAPAMAAAIIRALKDEETGTGWGPDITVAGYLRASLPESLR